MPETSTVKTPLLRIANGALSLIASRMLKQLVGFLVEVALVRWLAPEIWEQAARWLAFSLTATVVLQFGFPESVLTLGARSEQDQQAKLLLFRAAGLMVVLTATAALPLLFLPALRQSLLGSAKLPVMLWFVLYVAAEVVLGAIPSFFVARRHVRVAASFGLVARIPSIVGALLAVSCSPSLGRVTSFMALGSLASVLIGFVLCESVAPGLPTQRASFQLWDQLRYATPVGLTRIAQMANNQLDKLVVLTTLPQAAFGTYYLGAFEVQLVPMICQAVTTVMMPELSTAPDTRSFLELWHASIQKTLLVAMPLFAFLFVFGELLLVVVYGPVHRAAALPFRIFQLLLLHRFTNYALVFQALGRPRVPLQASILMLVLNAPLSLFLSRQLGMAGAALATVSALYASTIYTFVELRRALDLPWSRLLPWSDYFRTLGVACMAVLPPFLLCSLLPEALPALLSAAVLYLVTYFLLARATGVIGAGDYRFVSETLRLRFLRAPEGA